MPVKTCICHKIIDLDSGIPEPEDKPDTDGDDEYMSAVLLLSNVKCTQSEIASAIGDGSINAGTHSCAGGTAVVVISVDDENDFDTIANGFDVKTTAFLTENQISAVAQEL